MTAMIKYLIISLFLFATAAVTAQGVRVTDTVKIPAGYKAAFNRELNHDLIDKEQKLILASDGIDDAMFNPSTDNDINFTYKSIDKKGRRPSIPDRNGFPFRAPDKSKIPAGTGICFAIFQGEVEAGIKI